MKKFLALIILMAAQMSFAGMCVSSSELLPALTKNYNQMQAEAKVSSATNMDVLLAEKALIDVRLCQGPTDGKFMDVNTISDLSKNINARFNILENSFTHGTATKSEFALVRAELNAFYNVCSFDYVIDANNYALNGVITPQDQQIVIAACTQAVAPVAAAPAASAAK